jgi:biotin synthase
MSVKYETKTFQTLAQRIISGDMPDNSEYLSILSASDEELLSLLQGADMLRNAYFGRKIHLCAICNGKSGKCTEDCVFCSQSKFAQTQSPVYPLMGKDELRKGALWALKTPINRYSVVTSGRGLSQKEIIQIAEAIAESDKSSLQYCVSLGIIHPDDFEILKKAGVSRYHHNLETARSLFETICTTHTYQERLKTIIAAKNAGLSVCAGGLFGLGETDEQVLELALELKLLDVNAIPLNFLIPVKGTRTENADLLTPIRCLKIIALFRYVLPTKEIIVCGGREYNLKHLHPMIFYAGASGMMTGNYLTAKGRTLGDDLDMLKQLHFQVRDK